MSRGTPPRPSARSDAQRNRERVLAAARTVFAEPSGPNPPAGGSQDAQSMAEIARRAGVGRATVYRNFATRRDLLEALFADDIETIVAAAVPSPTAPGDALVDWLFRFAEFENSKHVVVTELLAYTDLDDPRLGGGRQRVLTAGRRLLVEAQAVGDIRSDVTLEQTLDLVLAVVGLDRPPADLHVLLGVALDGLRAPNRRRATR